MMNKGLEVIEAHHLYGVGLDALEVLVHPESIIHSLVEFADSSMLAHLGLPDMRTAIAGCLAWPRCVDTGVEPLDLALIGRLNFEKPDPETFPCLTLACQALAAGNSATVALNAANEVAVELFLAGKLPFAGIAGLIAHVLRQCDSFKLIHSQTALLDPLDEKSIHSEVAALIAIDVEARAAAYAAAGETPPLQAAWS